MQLKDYVFIVFGSEHYNPLGIIRSLGEAGINPIAVIVRGRRTLTSKSRYIKKLHMVEDIEEGYRLIQERYNQHNSTNKAFLLTGEDDVTSFLDMHYEALKDGFIFQNAGKDGQITHYMDKNNINILAEKHGFNVLHTYITPKGIVPEDVEYPVITKSISSNAGGKKDVFLCHSEQELKEAFSKITSNTVLLQKYIEKKNELCLDGLSVNKGEDVFISMGTSYEYILPMSYSQYMSMFNYTDKRIIEIIRNMLSEIGYEGIFTIEFLIDKDDTLYFLEVNLRNSGWSYASTCVGMNLPMIWAESMLQGHIGNVYKKIPEGSKAMADLDDFRARVRRGNTSIFTWLKDFKNCTAVFYYNKNDKRPLWSFLLSKFIKAK